MLEILVDANEVLVLLSKRIMRLGVKCLAESQTSLINASFLRK